MISGTHVVDINGPNCCEVLDKAELLALCRRIGPDVLRKDADPDKAWARISKSRVSIGQLLMDQSVLSGIGNIYRSEILWRQGVHPKRSGSAVTRDEFDRIWTDAVQLLEIGVKHNAIITVDGVKKSRSRYGERVISSTNRIARNAIVRSAVSRLQHGAPLPVRTVSLCK